MERRSGWRSSLELAARSGPRLRGTNRTGRRLPHHAGERRVPAGRNDHRARSVFHLKPHPRPLSASDAIALAHGVMSGPRVDCRSLRMPPHAAKKNGSASVASAADDELQDGGAQSAGDAEGKASAVRPAGLCEALQGVCISLAAAKSEADVLRVVVDEGARALRLLNIAYWRLEDSWLVMRGSNGYSSELVSLYGRLPLNSPMPIASVARSGQAQWFASQQEYARGHPVAETL